MREEAPYSPGLGGLHEDAREASNWQNSRKDVLRNDKPYLTLPSRKS